jgi:hypothetical protein
MSDPNATLDPAIQKGLVDFIKQRLGLLGALAFKNEVTSCACKPCQTIKAILSGADIPEETQ